MEKSDSLALSQCVWGFVHVDAPTSSDRAGVVQVFQVNAFK